MEENKAKMVNMGAKDNGSKTGNGMQNGEKKKLTYEQLNDACNQLWQQNKQLAVRNRELEQYALNKRMDYLFKVLEFSDKFSSDFIIDCASEIEAAMTITDQPDELVKKETVEGENLEGKGL